MIEQQGSATRKRIARSNAITPEFGLGVFAVLLGLYVAFDASSYNDGSTYDNLGPSLMPFVIAAGLIVSGLSIAGNAWLSRPAALEQMDGMPVLLVAAAVILPILFLQPIGWIPVISVVFALGSRAFGSRRIFLDLGVGLLFGVATLVIFNYGLGRSLPTGSILSRFLG